LESSPANIPPHGGLAEYMLNFTKNTCRYHNIPDLHNHRSIVDMLLTSVCIPEWCKHMYSACALHAMTTMLYNASLDHVCSFSSTEGWHGPGFRVTLGPILDEPGRTGKNIGRFLERLFCVMGAQPSNAKCTGCPLDRHARQLSHFLSS